MAKTFMSGSGGSSGSSDQSADPRAELNAAAFDSLDKNQAQTLDVGGSQLLSAGGDPVAGAIASRGSGTSGAGSFDSKSDFMGSVRRQVEGAQRVSKTYSGSYDQDLSSWSSFFGTDGAAQTTDPTVADATGGSTATRSQGIQPMLMPILSGLGGSDDSGGSSTPWALVAAVGAGLLGLLALVADDDHS